MLEFGEVWQEESPYFISWVKKDLNRNIVSIYKYFYLIENSLWIHIKALSILLANIKEIVSRVMFSHMLTNSIDWTELITFCAILFPVNRKMKLWKLILRPSPLMHFAVMPLQRFLWTKSVFKITYVSCKTSLSIIFPCFWLRFFHCNMMLINNAILSMSTNITRRSQLMTKWA